ncbi:MAG TPA: NUDIX domain-containing protein [Acetobacteraceae bacterium]|nr:NUDIX domain-containing protein [Acetobacteraceae bacterium]
MAELVVLPRHAASLLLLREAASGPEVLMGLRHAGHRFMPNRLVFPGGGVDAGDHAAPAATPLRPAVRARLEAAADAALAHALAIAAARELEEETGLSLGCPPPLGALDYLCRAVTPDSQPVRFDARFFVVPAEAASGTLAGSGELEGLRFYPLAEALALDLAGVTRRVLARLMVWRDLTPAQREAVAAEEMMLRRP